MTVSNLVILIVEFVLGIVDQRHVIDHRFVVVD